MATIRSVLSDMSVLTGLHMLPDSVALTTDEAAIFLRLSPSTMERMRKDGSGPNYIQGGAKGAKGVNQKVTYLKLDLIKWQESRKVSNSMQASVNRAQAFVPYADPTPKRSHFDLVTRLPFYVDANGAIAGSVHATPIGTIVLRLGSTSYVWLSPLLAVQKAWSSEMQFLEFASQLRHALAAAMAAIDCGTAGNKSQGIDAVVAPTA